MILIIASIITVLLSVKSSKNCFNCEKFRGDLQGYCSLDRYKAKYNSQRRACEFYTKRKGTTETAGRFS